MLQTKKNNLILLYKPENISSFRALGAIKKSLNTKKVGHTGTLDPFACGLMVVLTGQYTKLAQYFEAADKRYRAILKFGVATESMDTEGQITSRCEYIPTLDEIKKVLGRFIGKIEQVPPAYSAIRINGKRAYEHARAGEAVEMQSREVYIESIDIINYADGLLEFEVSCGKGTYIRSLAQDVALACNSLGHLIFLERTEVGGLSSKDAVEPNDFDYTKVVKISKKIIGENLKIACIDMKKDFILNLKYGKTLEEEYFLQDKIEKGLNAIFCEDKFVALVEKGKDKLYYKGVFLEDENI